MSGEVPMDIETDQMRSDESRRIEALKEQEGPELAEQKTEYPYNGIIVFGHGFRAEREGLSVEARIRVLAAYQLFKDGVADRIIVTGGLAGASDKEKFGDNLTSNGEMMRDYLVNELGIPADKVIFENKSTKTVDNVGHALNELHDKGLPEDNFVTVSTWYHMRRIADIMKKFGLNSAAVGAEEGLRSRAQEHANKMKQREIEKGLSQEQIDKNYQMRLHRYDRMMERLSLKDPGLISELQNEDKWLEAMKDWGYWGPLALAVRGPKLKEIVEQNKDDIEAWITRHPDLGVTIEDLVEGNFDYMELVTKGREIPS